MAAEFTGVKTGSSHFFDASSGTPLAPSERAPALEAALDAARLEVLNTQIVQSALANSGLIGSGEDKDVNFTVFTGKVVFDFESTKLVIDSAPGEDVSPEDVADFFLKTTKVQTIAQEIFSARPPAPSGGARFIPPSVPPRDSFPWPDRPAPYIPFRPRQPDHFPWPRDVRPLPLPQPEARPAEQAARAEDLERRDAAQAQRRALQGIATLGGVGLFAAMRHGMGTSETAPRQPVAPVPIVETGAAPSAAGTPRPFIGPHIRAPEFILNPRASAPALRPTRPDTSLAIAPFEGEPLAPTRSASVSDPAALPLPTDDEGRVPEALISGRPESIVPYSAAPTMRAPLPEHPLAIAPFEGEPLAPMRSASVSDPVALPLPTDDEGRVPEALISGRLGGRTLDTEPYCSPDEAPTLPWSGLQDRPHEMAGLPVTAWPFPGAAAADALDVPQVDTFATHSTFADPASTTLTAVLATVISFIAVRCFRRRRRVARDVNVVPDRHLPGRAHAGAQQDIARQGRIRRARTRIDRETRRTQDAARRAEQRRSARAQRSHAAKGFAKKPNKKW